MLIVAFSTGDVPPSVVNASTVTSEMEDEADIDEKDDVFEIDGVLFGKHRLPLDVQTQKIYPADTAQSPLWKWYLKLCPPVSASDWMYKHTNKKQIVLDRDRKYFVCLLCVQWRKDTIPNWKLSTWLKNCGSHASDYSNAKKHMRRQHCEVPEVKRFLQKFSDAKEETLSEAVVSYREMPANPLRMIAVKGGKEKFYLQLHDMMSTWIINSNAPFSVLNDDFNCLLNFLREDTKGMTRESFQSIVDAKFNMVSLSFLVDCCI